jgi:hypothetical protein
VSTKPPFVAAKVLGVILTLGLCAGCVWLGVLLGQDCFRDSETLFETIRWLGIAAAVGGGVWMLSSAAGSSAMVRQGLVLIPYSLFVLAMAGIDFTRGGHGLCTAAGRAAAQAPSAHPAGDTGELLVVVTALALGALCLVLGTAVLLAGGVWKLGRRGD